MKKLLLILAFVIVSMSTTSAFAKDLCVADSLGHVWKFDTIKLLKGKSTPLVGRVNINNDSANNHPVSGAVTLDSDNLTTRIVLTFSHGDLNETIIFSMVGDKSFNATGRFLIIGGAATTPYTWGNIPCDLAAAANVQGAPEHRSSFLP